MIKKKEEGQVLVIAAAAFLGVVVFLLTLYQLLQLLTMVNYMAESVQFAAQVGARPSGSSLVTGNTQIDPSEADVAIRAELSRSLDQLRPVENKTDILDNAVIDIANPSSGCATLPGDPTCYPTSVVRVRMRATFNLMGIVDVPIEREGLASINAMTQAGGSEPTLPVATPVAIPTIVYQPTETP